MRRTNIALALGATLAVGCTDVQELLTAIGHDEGPGQAHGGPGDNTPRPPPASCGHTIDVDDLYASVASDLSRIDADDRSFQRYVTLANRFNAGVCGSALDGSRAAVGELFNITSTRPSIQQPVAIDARELTYRVDLRDYGWSRQLELDGETFADGWEAALALSPFAIEYAGPDADAAKADAATRVPLLNFDALADVATEGSLYYALIDVPGSDGELMAALGIDFAANRADGSAVLAGTTRSRISRADRIVERHELEVRAGFLWRALDFLGDSDLGIFDDPLSPESDGSVTLFTLPNGLLGFAIFDSGGDRVDSSDILLDTNQNDFRVRAASSCLNCHSAGVIPVEDEVLEFVQGNADELDPDLVAGVERLYPEQDELDALIAGDSAAYADALARAGVSPAAPDPLASAFFEFDLDLPLARMAGDLWVSRRAILERLGALPPLFRLPAADRDDYAVVYAEAACIVAGSDNRPVGCE